MLIPMSAKVEKVAAKEPGRYAMHAVQFERKSALGCPALIATDGRALVVVPVEAEEHDTDGFVTREALDAARKVARKSRRGMPNARMIANGSVAIYDRESNALPERPANPALVGRTIHGTTVEVVPSSGPMLPAEPDTTQPVLTMPRETINGEFPRYGAVIPSGERREHRISFNVEFLRNLADAIGSEVVTLGIACQPGGSVKGTEPIRVTGGTHGALGVLMPVTIDGGQTSARSDAERISESLALVSQSIAEARDMLPHKPQSEPVKSQVAEAHAELKRLARAVDALRERMVTLSTVTDPA